MSETLQIYGGRDGTAAKPNGPTQIILNRDYLDYAIKVVNGARSELRIFAYAWRWYENRPESKIQQFNAALMRATKRGVRVRAIVESENMKNMLVARGVECRMVPGNRSMHAKVLCSDDHSILVGSHNLTMRAFEDNIETSVLVHEFEPIAQFSTYFDAVWNAYG